MPSTPAGELTRRSVDLSPDKPEAWGLGRARPNPARSTQLHSVLVALVEQSLCFDQVARSESLGERCVASSKLRERCRLLPAISLCETQCGAQLERPRPLLARDFERPPECTLRSFGV